MYINRQLICPKEKNIYVLLNPQNRAHFLKKVCYKTTFAVSPIKLGGLHLMRYEFFFFYNIYLTQDMKS